MDDNTYIDLIKAQITSLSAQAAAALGSQHQVSLLLLMAATTINQYTADTGEKPRVGAPDMQAYAARLGAPLHPVLPPAVQAVVDAAHANDADPQPQIPAGFADEDTYHAFLAEQFADDLAVTNAAIAAGNADLADDEDPDDDATAADVAASIKDVVGLVPDAAGNLREVGNLDDAAAFADGLIEQAETHHVEDEDGNINLVRERRATDNAITITYTRPDGRELTDAQVRNIIDHPISASLQHIGRIQLVAIDAGENVNSKQAVFALLEDGKIDLRGLALGAVAYRGQHVFPGIGRVQAVGSVNWA